MREFCARHRESLGHAGDDVGRPEREQLAVRVHLVAVAPREALGRQHAAGEADQGDAGSVLKQRPVGRGVEQGEADLRQARPHRADHRDAAGVEPEARDREHACRHGDEAARQYRCQPPHQQEGEDQREPERRGREVAAGDP